MTRVTHAMQRPGQHAPEAAAVRVVALLRVHALGEVGDEIHVVADVAPADVLAEVTAGSCNEAAADCGRTIWDIKGC